MVQELQEEMEQGEAAYRGLQSKSRLGVDQLSTSTVSNSLSPHSTHKGYHQHSTSIAYSNCHVCTEVGCDCCIYIILMLDLTLYAVAVMEE